jgi:hypothetical protein
MKKQRKHYAPEEKVAILRRHFGNWRRGEGTAEESPPAGRVTMIRVTSGWPTIRELSGSAAYPARGTLLPSRQHLTARQSYTARVCFLPRVSFIELCSPVENNRDGRGIGFGWRVHQDALPVGGHVISNLPRGWTKVVDGRARCQSQAKQRVHRSNLERSSTPVYVDRHQLAVRG